MSATYPDQPPDGAPREIKLSARGSSAENLQRNYEGTNTADNAYTFKVQFKPLGGPDSAYQQILNGTVDVTGTNEGNGSLSFDFSALQQAIPTEKATGQFTLNYTVTGSTKTIDVSLANFTPDTFITDPEGNPIRPPRSGQYVFQRTQGVGGSLKFEEDVELLCPHTATLIADPSNPSTVQTVARWGTNSSGQHVGRADSLATGGGNIPSTDQWQAVTCFVLDSDLEGAWEMQDLTMASNAVNWFASSTTVNDGTASDVCDPVFAPNPDGTQANFNLWSGLTSVNFSDNSVVPYPGE